MFDDEETFDYPIDEELASARWVRQDGIPGKRMIQRSGCRSPKTYFEDMCRIVGESIGIKEEPFAKEGLYVLSDSLCIAGKDVNLSVRVETDAAVVSMIMAFRIHIPVNRTPLIPYVCNKVNASLFSTLVYDGVWPDLYYLEAIIPCDTVFGEAEFRHSLERLKQDTQFSIHAIRKLGRKLLPGEYRTVVRSMTAESQEIEAEDPGFEEAYRDYMEHQVNEN